MKESVQKLSVAYTYNDWRTLLDLVLSSLIVLNKRRGGEVSRLLLSAYIGMPDWVQTSNQEVLNSLSPLERKLLERYVKIVPQYYFGVIML